VSRKDTKGSAARVASWLLRLPADQCGQADAVFLLRTKGLTEDDVINRWEGKARDHNVEAAEEMLDAAAGDCDARGHDMQYAVSLVHQEEDRTIATTVVRLHPAEKAAVEPADAEGMLRQSMRHNEVLVRQMADMQRTTMQQQTDIISMLAKRLQLLEEGRGEALAMERNAILSAAAAEGDDTTKEARARREQKIENLVEAVAMRMLQPGVGGTTQ